MITISFEFFFYFIQQRVTVISKYGETTELPKIKHKMFFLLNIINILLMFDTNKLLVTLLSKNNIWNHKVFEEQKRSCLQITLLNLIFGHEQS